jgi:hypothetical protein
MGKEMKHEKPLGGVKSKGLVQPDQLNEETQMTPTNVAKRKEKGKRVKNPTPGVDNLLAMPETLETALDRLNEQYCFVEQMAQVVRIPSLAHPALDFYAPTIFASALEAPRRFNGRSVAKVWLGWSGRRHAYRLVYAPGEPRFTSDGNLNTWIPSPITAAPGDLSLWHDYLDRIFKSDPTYREWFLAWLAYPIQHPSAKLHTAVVFWSEATATGKSMLGWIMSTIYGQTNFASIDEGTLHSSFNFWANGRQFIMGEEIKGAGAQKNADRLKAMITQKTVWVNIKNRAQFELNDCINYYFTSNHPDAFYLDPNDRRFFVHHLGAARYPATLFKESFEPWFTHGGAAAIRWELENIDLSKPIIGGDPYSPTPAPFNPGAAAPQTAAREAMVESNLSDADEWLDDLTDSPTAALSGAEWTLATADELWEAFLLSHPHPDTKSQTFRRMLRAKLKSVYSDNKLELLSGKRTKLYSLYPTTPAGMRLLEGGAGAKEIIMIYTSEGH